MKLMISDSASNPARLAFAQHLFEAGTVGGEGEPAYSATVIIGKQHPSNAALLAAEEQVAKEKWGAKADGILKSIRAAGKGVVKDGDSKAEYAGFEGNNFVSTRSKVRPTVINRDRTPLTAADGVIYSGCHGNVQVEVWAQDNSYGKRINAQLLGVQFTRDGDSFGGGTQPAKPDDFADLSADNVEAGLLD
jgi:hypothetical protein